MPRKSADALNVVRVSGERLPAPEHLTPEQREEWVSIVDSLAADYFRPGDVALLAAFCTANALYKKTAARVEADGGILTDDKGRLYAHPGAQVMAVQAGSMAQMAVKLRLCPSSRISESQARTQSKGAPTRPWEFEKNA